MQDRLGEAELNKLSRLYVGTVHSYCFRILQQFAPRYETYDVLDDNQLTAFLKHRRTRTTFNDGGVHHQQPDELWPEILRKLDGDDQTQSGGSGRKTFAPEDDCFGADDFDELDE